MGQHDDRSVAVWANLGEGLFRPLDDDLVGARHPLFRGEAAARVDADRAPADPSGGGAEGFARVDRSDHDQARRRPEDLGEDLRAFVLDQAAAADVGGKCRQAAGVIPVRFLTVEQNDQLRAGGGPFDHREDDRPLVAVCEREQDVGQAQSRRSTNTSISPPQGSPTVSASSSEIP